QHLQRVAPAVLVDQVVPLGDDVAQRAPVVTERDAAVHAPRALRPQVVDGELVVDLVPVQHAQFDGPPLGHLAVNLFETGGLSHETFLDGRKYRLNRGDAEAAED